MAYYEEFPVREIQVENITSLGGGVPRIVAGDQTTLAAVFAEVPSDFGIGSMYLSTAGKIYVKVANNGAAADWERVTTTAAD